MFKNNSKIKALIISEHSFDFNNDEYKYNQLMDCLFCNSDIEIVPLLKAGCIPDAIITLGKPWETYANMSNMPDWIRHIWFHFEDTKDHAFEVFNQTINNQLSGYSRPEISIIMPLHNSLYLEKAYQSICEQTNNDWELVLVDDSPDDTQHCTIFAKEIANNDIRVSYHRLENEQTNGNIGLSKWRAACLSKGRFIFEMDHDDELFPWSLSMLCDAIKEFPYSGFFYSDCVDIDKDNNMIKAQYGNNYAFGFGNPYTINAGNDLLFVNGTPNINSVTTRHIVGMPNHFRCWSREVYFAVGGHNPYMRIADDYELCVKTLLLTKFTKIQYPCYKQRFDGNNSQDVSNNRSDIQNRVALIAQFYNSSISNAITNQCGYDMFNEDVSLILEKGNNKQLPHCNNIFIPNM